LHRRKTGESSELRSLNWRKERVCPNYLAMIEIAQKFPSADVLDRLAVALGISPNELFSVSVSPERVIEQMQQKILENLDRAIEHALDKAIAKRCGIVVPAETAARG